MSAEAITEVVLGFLKSSDERQLLYGRQTGNYPETGIWEVTARMRSKTRSEATGKAADYCGRLTGCLSSRPWGLVVANPGRTRCKQGYCAEGLRRLAQNCLAGFLELGPLTLEPIMLGGSTGP